MHLQIKQYAIGERRERRETRDEKETREKRETRDEKETTEKREKRERQKELYYRKIQLKTEYIEVIY